MNYFILHGHFYQPPRENPWTGFIDRQESAYPYSDWNNRITAECYGASTRTSVYDQGSIVKIVNCFEYLSFNIGPTLLSWMEKSDSDPRTVEKIIEGDRISQVKNSGHGNAIAQVYSHMIMPLATEKDQYTQIIWGLHDFRRRFGRESEGLWLGETAINNETAAILVDSGIKFVILSPFQAKNIIVDSKVKDVLGGKIDTTQPYKLHTKNGVLSIFFYNPKLASDISFGDALSSTENLHAMINHEFNNQQQINKLVHTATDGEVYGHHKSFGNMALAKLIYDITSAKNSEFKFTNYGYYLENNPPNLECELYLGEDGAGSSWSCAHGVGRWMRDCGCSTGGDHNWNQKWRRPLRESFDVLRDHIYQVAEDSTKDLIKDIWVARNDYFIPMTSRLEDDYSDFFNKNQLKELTVDEKRHVLQIMQSLRYAMLMYTSCGWFFSELSGIETIQDMLYAYRAFEFTEDLLGDSVLEEVKKVLSKAHSNLSKRIDGSEILNDSIKKYKIDNDSFFEYICWSVLNQSGDNSILETDEYVINIEYIDLDNNQFVIKLIDTIGKVFLIACTLNKDIVDANYELLWRSVEGSRNNYSDIWDNKDTEWKISQITNLPLFLKVRFIEQHAKINQKVEKKCQGVDNNILFLNAIWGAENLLLPYEKELLSFDFLSRVHEFVSTIKKSMNIESLVDVENFIKEIEVLKNIVESDKDMEFYLEPVVEVMREYMYKSLYQYNTITLREVRMLFWSIKSYVDPVRLDILRDIIYEFYLKESKDVNNPAFLIELKTLMRDMGFVVK